MQQNNRFIIYRIFYGDTLVYIGRTKQPLQSRIHGHLFKNPMQRSLFIDQISRIEYAFLSTEADMNLYELYYINLWKPPLNVDDKSKDQLTIRLPELEWHNFSTPLWTKWQQEIRDGDLQYKMRQKENKVMSKVGVKQFFKISWAAMKKTCKETFEAVFKSGFKDGCKNALTILAKTFLFDWDDLKLYRKDMLSIATEPLENMVTHFVREGDNLVPISDEAVNIFAEYGIESLKILPNGDIDWDSIAIKSVKMDMSEIDLSSDAISSYLNGDMIDGFTGKTPEDQLSKYLRNNTYSQANSNLMKELNVPSIKSAKESLEELGKQQFGLNRLPTITPHDHFSTKRMIFVPYDIHNIVNHNGAIAVYKNSIKTIARSVESAMKNTPWGRILVKVFN